MNHPSDSDSPAPWTRRRFVAGASLATGASLAPRRGSGEAPDPEKAPLLEIGLMADAQFADVAPAGTRHYRRSPGKLEEAVARFNTRDLACVIHVGDLIDRDWSSFDTILGPLDQGRHPVRHVLGNHDFDVADSLKPRVPERLGLGTRHHSFVVSGVRIIVLDTTDVSTYAHPAGSDRTAEARKRLADHEARGLPQAKPWNGALGTDQVDWFAAQLGEARKAGDRVLVFSHHPFHPPGGHNAWNDESVLELAGRQGSPIVAWFSGHNHAGAYAVRDGIHHVTLHGMVETESTNAFAVARLHADRIEIEGHGREPSRTLAFA